MLRGFISGVVWGAIFSIGSLWSVSQLGGMIRLFSAPSEIAVTAPDTVSGDIGGDGAGAPAEATDEAIVTPDALAATIGAVEPDSPPVADTASIASPDTSGADALGDAPTEQDSAAIEPADDQTPQESEVAALDQPAGETVPEAGQPPAETVVVETTTDAPAGDTSTGQAVAEPASETDVEPAQAPAAVAAAPAQEETPLVDFSAPQVVELDEQAQEEPEPVAEQVAEPAAPEPTEEPAPEPTGDRGSVVVNRLPTLGGGDAGTEPEVVAEDAATEDPALLEGLPAIQRYAREFEPSGQPLMSIILITDANGQLMQGMSNLPVPVTYAINAADDQAADMMKRAREADQEVLAIAPLSDGAGPAEVETSFAVYLAKLDQAVGVMDDKNIAFQSDRQTANQVIAAAKAEGLGLVTYPRGLNSAMQVAEREGVPAGLVFRIFDEGGKDREAIKRFLDQAAFRAGQQNGVIMLGHDRPETVAAILEWVVGNRASTIALAPVSVMLSD